MLITPLLTVLLLSSPAYGQNAVNRCQFIDGSILFSQRPCPADTQASAQQITTNTPIRLASEPLNKTKRSLNVRGISRATKCDSGLSDQALRQALIRQQPRKGMSRAQVLSAFGKPERINTTNQGERFTYQLPNGNRRTLQFDEQGCLKR